MKIHHCDKDISHQFIILMRLYWTNFLHSLGWVDGWRKIKNKDHLRPAEAETGAELCNYSLHRAYEQKVYRHWIFPKTSYH